jgi:hypothetical protein
MLPGLALPASLLAVPEKLRGSFSAPKPRGILFDAPVARELAERTLEFHHVPLLASRTPSRSEKKVATSIDEFAAHGKAIEVPDPR